MWKRSGSGLRRAAVAAALVAGIGMMAAGAGGAGAADKEHDPNKPQTTAQNCAVEPSYYRKCGDTGSSREARAEPRHVSEPDTPADSEPVGASAPAND